MLQSAFASVRVRLVLLVAIAMLPAFVLVVWVAFEQRQERREHAGETASLLAEAVSTQQDQVVQDAHDLAAKLAAAPEVIAADRARCASFLREVMSVQDGYTGVSLTDPAGNIVCSNLDLGGPVSVADREYFQEALRSGAFTTSGYLVAKVVGTPTMAFALPVTDGRGETFAVVIGGVDILWLNDFVRRLDVPPGTSLTILDPDGVVLARRPDPEEWVGQDVSATPLGSAVLREASGRAELRSLDDVDRLFAYAPLGSDGNAYVAVGSSTEEAYAGINAGLTRNLGLLGAVGLAAVCAAWFVGDALVARKVGRVLAVAERVRHGDLEARTGLSGSSDVDRLGRGFDTMAAALEEREAERERAREELAQRANDLARSNAELEQFAYVASHDLQEPLRMVASYTQLLARRYNGRLDGEAHEFIDYAVDGASRMQALINDLLTLSRVGTRGGELEPVEAGEALKAALRNLEGAIEESGAEITHDPLPRVLADRSQLIQLFQNLVGNAVKFRGAGPPRVRVSARRDGEDVEFSVRDNGIGIDPQYVSRIFMMFQRLHGREEYSGTGIGLAICKKIVERHGGHIWVDSRPGAGATFSFTMRAAAAPVPVAA